MENKDRYRNYLQGCLDMVNNEEGIYFYRLNPFNTILVFYKDKRNIPNSIATYDGDSIIDIMKWKDFIKEYWTILEKYEHSNYLLAWLLGEK